MRINSPRVATLNILLFVKSVQTSLLIPPSTDIFQYFPVFVNGKSLKSNTEVTDEVQRSSISRVDVEKNQFIPPKPPIAHLKDGVNDNSPEVVSHVEVKVSKPVIGDDAKMNQGSTTRMQESSVYPNDSNNLHSAPVPPISHLFRSAMETCMSKLQGHSLHHYK